MKQPATDAEVRQFKVHHPRFSRQYERISQSGSERRLLEPLRKELLEQAEGKVLEIGTGNGLNFPFYLPDKVTSVEATEPDSTMLAFAEKRLSQARVPVHLTPAPAEALPFPDASFDCVVGTLVLCSVYNPARTLQEIHRVLKPGGTLLLLEHVRARGRLAAMLQDWMVPFTTRLTGNCHWNRATGETVGENGFQVITQRRLRAGIFPVLLIKATS